MQSSNRERGIVLRRLDPEALGRKALDHLRVMWPEVEWTAAGFAYGYAVIEVGTDDGTTVYVVNTEGVGYEVTPGKPWVLDVIASWKDEDGRPHSGMSHNAYVYLSPHEALELSRDDSTEDIDLADLVREFGDRLEVNFSLWYDRLTEKVASR